MLTSAVQEARKRGSRTMKVTQKQPAPNRTATSQEALRLPKKTATPQEVVRIPDPLTSGKKKANITSKVVKVRGAGQHNFTI